MNECNQLQKEADERLESYLLGLEALTALCLHQHKNRVGEVLRKFYRTAPGPQMVDAPDWVRDLVNRIIYGKLTLKEEK